MTEQSPRPWRYEEDRFHAGSVRGRDGDLVADNVARRDGPILAATPDLLDALEGMTCSACGYRVGEERHGSGCVRCDPARAAVAKARGKP